MCHGETKIQGLIYAPPKACSPVAENGQVVVHLTTRKRIYQFISTDKTNDASGKKLSEIELETLRRWIEAGAS